MTLIELLTILAVIALFVALLASAVGRAKAKSIRMCCVNDLKQVGIAFRTWAYDHNNEYPMAVSETNGGSMDFTAGPNVFRHFQVMSNEVSTPKILLCPTEWDGPHTYATNGWSSFSNSNLSYFIGVDARETNAMMLLSGDRNITDGTALKNGLLELTTNNPASWTREMHKKIGNVLLVDGSVQQDNSAWLQTNIANSGVATNRLQMP